MFKNNYIYILKYYLSDIPLVQLVTFKCILLSLSHHSNFITLKENYKSNSVTCALGWHSVLHFCPLDLIYY